MFTETTVNEIKPAVIEPIKSAKNYFLFHYSAILSELNLFLHLTVNNCYNSIQGCKQPVLIIGYFSQHNSTFN